MQSTNINQTVRTLAEEKILCFSKGSFFKRKNLWDGEGLIHRGMNEMTVVVHSTQYGDRIASSLQFRYDTLYFPAYHMGMLPRIVWSD